MTAPTPAPRSDAPEPSTVDAGELSEVRLADEQVDTLVSITDDIADEHPYALDRLVGTIEAWIEAAAARITADREKRARAEAWDAALSHAWGLNDPAYTAVDTHDTRGVLVNTDIEQARRENPYRASSAPTEGEQR